jgi:phosphatidate phosphatase PAH1
MEKINNFISGLAEACNMNKSSFSFAMDVIVIQHQDNSFSSSPFYVNFGRFKLARSSNTQVQLVINDIPSSIFMVLSRSGRGHFIRFQTSGNLTAEFEENKSSDSEEERNHEEGGEEHSDSVLFQDELSNPRNDKRRLLEKRQAVVSLEYRLTSEEIQRLALKSGTNSVKYVTQGGKQKVVEGRIFLWQENDRIVVSDIDGTLTKSDVMGHLCYIVGKDWTRTGAACCYSQISQRNYKILYLTARSVNQMQSTSKLLKKMHQNDSKLPIGPLILSNCGMFRSLLREMSNHSKFFKENALRDIQNLFPLNLQPFWAGFGNRSGDALAYLRVGMKEDLIFIFSKQKKPKPFIQISSFSEISINFDKFFPIYN